MKVLFVFSGHILKTTADRGLGMVLNDSKLSFTCLMGRLTKFLNDFKAIFMFFFLKKAKISLKMKVFFYFLGDILKTVIDRGLGIVLKDS